MTPHSLQIFYFRLLSLLVDALKYLLKIIKLLLFGQRCWEFEHLVLILLLLLNLWLEVDWFANRPIDFL